MKKLTAVEWFATILDSVLDLNPSEFGRIQEAFEQAKEMEKQQIMDAFWNGDNSDCLSEQNSKEFAEKYYNETYKTK